MRILFLSDFCPWPLDPGYRQRIYHLLQALARRHTVTLVTIMTDDLRDRPFPPATDCVELIPLSPDGCLSQRTRRFERWASGRERIAALLSSPYPNQIRRFYSVDILRVLRQLRTNESFDFVWAERAPAAELARKAGFKRIVVDLPDIETKVLARFLQKSGWYNSKPVHYLELARLYVYEQLMPLRFWRLAPCEDEDRQFFRTRRSNVFVLPNGVENNPPSPHVTTDSPQFLFVGALGYEPNIDAVTFFMTSILPLVRRTHPSASLVMVGREAVPSVLRLVDGERCVIASNVNDLTPCFDAATVFVAPIRFGGGTRLKVLEALVRNKAVVATTVAMEGLDGRPGADVEVADSPGEFAAACSRLLQDPDARMRLAASGRARVLDQFLWDTVVHRLDRILNLSAGAGPTSSAATTP
jgi:glycosyltransferase involved in cell wall biosynthesis